MHRILLAVLFAAAGCAPTGEERFNVLTEDGVSLPVVARGNTGAGQLVLFTHGGPGVSRLDFVSPWERALEREFRVVSWAQRTTQYATGPVGASNVSLERHVDDLDRVLAVVAARYPGERIVHMGWSWGGTLLLRHLSRPGHRPVDAAVVVAGPLVGREAERQSWELLSAHAEARISSGADTGYWQSVLALAADWEERLASAGPVAYLESHARRRLDACEQRARDLGLPAGRPREPKDRYDPLSPFMLGDDRLTRVQRWTVGELLSFDLRAGLGSVTQPVLLLWGREDCNVPLASGLALLAALPAATLEVIDLADHEVLDEAPDAVAAAVRSLTAVRP